MDKKEILQKAGTRTYFEAASAIRPAAILIPLMEKGGELHLLFEVRSSDIPQGGDICFPGGGIEESETPFEAAVRESREELFLKENQIRVIAPMHLLQGPKGKMVYSVLGEIRNYDGRYSKDEVDHVFTMPLSFFLNHPPVSYDSEVRGIHDDNFPYELIRGGKRYQWQDRYYRRYFFYEVPEGKIWGLTAEAVFRFIETLM